MTGDTEEIHIILCKQFVAVDGQAGDMTRTSPQLHRRRIYMASTVPAIIVVNKKNNYLRETVITTVITRQYTVRMVVTNRKLPML